MPKQPVVSEEEEQMRRRGWSTYLGKQMAVAAMAAHAECTAAPGHG
jgi:hypothetical protein